MTMTTVSLTDIAVDAGTQVRVAINEDTVAEFAELMAAGEEFPPVVLFHDGSAYYMGDGFHRLMAAKRNKLTAIPATVEAGTKADALWFALGAHRKSAQRLTKADKEHAIRLAFEVFPDRSARMIAEQIGCSNVYVSRIREQVLTSSHLPDHTVGKDGKSYPAKRPQKPKETLPTPAETPKGKDKSREAVSARQQQIADMASRGYTVRQIAEAVSLTIERVNAIIKAAGIPVPARTMGRTRRHDANRIVEQMALSAANLTADVDLIDFTALDQACIPGWASTFREARKQLSVFIRRLEGEQDAKEVA